MKVIICGSRETGMYLEQIDAAVKLSGFEITEVVLGGATGVDTSADIWARRENIDRTTFHANWDGHGKAAGPLRNERMAKYADACIALPGGRGTADMVTRAKAHGLLVYDASWGSDMSNCNGCGKEMIWGEYEKTDDAGKVTLVKVPLDPKAPVYRILGHAADGTAKLKRLQPDEAGVSHFSTCAKANQFSGGNRK